MTKVLLQNITHSFDNVLYKDISFSLKSGESLAILGVSGSGKSTILNHLSTLLKPKNGSINLENFKDIYSLNERDLLHLRQKILGIIFQAHYLFRGFNAAENIRIAELISGQNLDMQMLKDFGIEHTLKQQIGELSGGQQQRLSIARVLTKKPQIILADEPTGNLDRDTARSVMDYLLGYIRTNGAAMVLATHDSKLAELCTKVALLEDKTLRFIKE